MRRLPVDGFLAGASAPSGKGTSAGAGLHSRKRGKASFFRVAPDAGGRGVCGRPLPDEEACPAQKRDRTGPVFGSPLGRKRSPQGGMTGLNRTGRAQRGRMSTAGEEKRRDTDPGRRLPEGGTARSTGRPGGTFFRGMSARPAAGGTTPSCPPGERPSTAFFSGRSYP